MYQLNVEIGILNNVSNYSEDFVFDAESDAIRAALDTASYLSESDRDARHNENRLIEESKTLNKKGYCVVSQMYGRRIVLISITKIYKSTYKNFSIKETLKRARNLEIDCKEDQKK